MAQMLSNDFQRRYTFIHELAFQALRTCCCYGTYISSKTPKSSRHILSTRQRKNGGEGLIVSMVIPLVENTIVSNEKAEGKATKRTKRSTKGRIRDLGKSGGCLFHISTKCLFLRVRTVTAGIHLINSPRVINFVR